MKTKIRILQILKQGNLVSGQQIAKSLKITRSDVHKHIDSLRREGYKILARRNRGYILKNPSSLKSYLQLENILKEKIAETVSIKHFPAIDSTQTRIKKLAENGAQEWTVVVADYQTSGYGRLKRAWSSDRGGLWFSYLLRPKIHPSTASSISLVVSLAALEAIKKITGINCSLKWPNDVVYIKRSRILKIAGIITEISTDIESINWLAVGCGINVNNEIPSELKEIALNLKSLTDKKISIIELLGNFLMEFYNLYNKFLEKGFGVFKDDYNQKCILSGKEVSITAPGAREQRGIAVGVDETGQLVLVSDGRKIKITAGDVSVRKI